MKFFQHPLAREIGVAVIVKLIVIAGIYFLFFSGNASHPGAEDVARHLSLQSQR